MGKSVCTDGKLAMGVLILATHKGRIKERLIAAFHDSLHGVSAEALPPELRRAWIDVHTKATAVEGTKESGRFAPSINALTEDEAVDLAGSIIDVEWMIVDADY